MNYLSFYWVVFNSLLQSIHCNVFCDNILEHLRNVFSLIFNGIVVSHKLFMRNLNHLSDLLVFYVSSLVWDISFIFYRYLLDSTFTLDRLSNLGDLANLASLANLRVHLDLLRIHLDLLRSHVLSLHGCHRLSQLTLRTVAYWEGLSLGT